MTWALPSSALITFEEARHELHLSANATVDQEGIERCIVDAGAEIETFTRRRFVSTGSDITEYHSFQERVGVLWTVQRPIISVTSIHESATRDWTSTALVSGTDYLPSLVRGKIERLSSGFSAALAAAEAEWWPSGIASGSAGLAIGWMIGTRTVRILYKAGYANTAAVPTIVKDVCKRLVALKWREISRAQQGVTSSSDQSGNFVRFGPARLTEEMKEALRDEVRLAQSRTAELDA